MEMTVHSCLVVPIEAWGLIKTTGTIELNNYLWDKEPIYSE